jgi:hypothetical protein
VRQAPPGPVPTLPRALRTFVATPKGRNHIAHSERTPSPQRCRSGSAARLEVPGAEKGVARRERASRALRRRPPPAPPRGTDSERTARQGRRRACLRGLSPFPAPLNSGPCGGFSDVVLIRGTDAGAGPRARDAHGVRPISQHVPSRRDGRKHLLRPRKPLLSARFYSGRVLKSPAREGGYGGP